MMKQKILLFFCVASLIFAGTLSAGEEDEVLGKTSDYVIRKSDLDRLVNYYPPEKQKYLKENPEQKVILVKRMLEIKIIADLSRKEGFDKRPEIAEQLQFMADDFIAKEFVAKVVNRNLTVSDADVKQYYENNQDKFSVPEQVRIRHILMKIPPKASDEEKKKIRERAGEIAEKLKKGEDFAKLAEEYSEDSGSKKKGGDLGYLSRGKMPKPFEKVVFTLSPGQTSDIVETKSGYHIIKVEDHKKTQIKTLDEVKESIRGQLRTELVNAQGVTFIQKAERDAGMEVYADKIRGQAAPK